LKGGLARVIFRRSNRYIIGQIVRSEEAKDYIARGVSSRSLLKYGWPAESKGSLKSLPAAYLTGFLLGQDIKEKVILDIGIARSIPKSRIYAFVKGLKDAGVNINVEEKMFPSDETLKRFDIEKIKQEIKNAGKNR